MYSIYTGSILWSLWNLRSLQEVLHDPNYLRPWDLWYHAVSESHAGVLVSTVSFHKPPKALNHANTIGLLVDCHRTQMCTPLSRCVRQQRGTPKPGNPQKVIVHLEI